MWLDRFACGALIGGELGDDARELVRSAAPGIAPAPRPEGYRENARAGGDLACPECRGALTGYVTEEKSEGARVALDICREHGVWFDAGEARILLTAAEMKRLTLAVEQEANQASA